jgi:AcrR family transcriptional regulator
MPTLALSVNTGMRYCEPVHRPRLAERKRQVVRDELSAAALRLLAYQGFEETTIDQIVAAAGVSRRTFFRYFRSKEDVIIAFLAEVGELAREQLAARPADEPPPVALHRALSVFVAEMEEHPEKSLRLARLTLETPALRARYLDRQGDWQAALAAELSRRTGLDPAGDMRPALAAGVALTAFTTALTTWAATGGAERLPDLFDRAFGLVEGSLRIG